MKKEQWHFVLVLFITQLGGKFHSSSLFSFKVLKICLFTTRTISTADHLHFVYIQRKTNYMGFNTEKNRLSN